jgi:hypothetical protein
VKKLQEEIKGKKDAKTEEDKLKIMGLKTTSNIQTLIRDLFHSPPSFKSVVNLSWVQPRSKKLIKATSAEEKNGEAKVETSAPVKRHAPITFDNDDSETRPAKQQKRNNPNNGNGQKMYTPPGGKFSSKFKGGNNGGRKFGGGGGNRRNFGGNKQGGGGGQGGRKKFGGGNNNGGGRRKFNRSY